MYPNIIYKYVTTSYKEGHGNTRFFADGYNGETKSETNTCFVADPSEEGEHISGGFQKTASTVGTYTGTPGNSTQAKKHPTPGGSNDPLKVPIIRLPFIDRPASFGVIFVPFDFNPYNTYDRNNLIHEKGHLVELIIDMIITKSPAAGFIKYTKDVAIPSIRNVKFDNGKDHMLQPQEMRATTYGEWIYGPTNFPSYNQK
jgi:hypothetical protein